MGRKLTIEVKPIKIENKMETQSKKIENISDYLKIDLKGNITAGGKENPSDMEIAAAVRTFASNYGKEANSIKDNDRFELGRANPKISYQKGKQMTKKEWIDEQCWSEEEFENMRVAGVLLKR